jgi:hypothetical protein
MNYAIMIAAAFILATIAVAAMSPFDHLPQRAPQESVAAAPTPPDEDSSSGGSQDVSQNGAQDGSSPGYKGNWPQGEAPSQ